jgi:hypothetical protein
MGKVLASCASVVPTSRVSKSRLLADHRDPLISVFASGAQFNERNTWSRNGAAIFFLNHHFDFGNRLWVIADTDKIRCSNVSSGMVSVNVLAIQCDFECSNGLFFFLPYASVFPISRSNQNAVERRGRSRSVMLHRCHRLWRPPPKMLRMNGLECSRPHNGVRLAYVELATAS